MTDLDRLAADPVEARLGMPFYLTSTPGTGGKLRATPEDFVVEEVPLAFPPAHGEGKYTVARVRARNWETNRLMEEIRRRLGLGRQDVFFAGTKDKRAVTTQYVSVRAPEEAVRGLGIRDVDVLDTFRAARAPKIGELVGNRFEIVVRGVEGGAEEGARRAREAVEQLSRLGGMPNYFGLQRFGVTRPITHEVGARILRGDLEGAVDLYVANPMEGEDPEAHAARVRYARERDAAAALAYYPRHMGFERTMLAALAHGHGADGALRALPRNLLTMFTYAFQSLLFNRVLTRRVERGLPLSGVVAGDLVHPADEDGLPDRGETIPVTEANAAKVARRVAAGKAFVTGLVPGASSRFAEGPMGEIERDVVAEGGVSAADFGAPALPEAGSGGTRRELLVPLGDVRVEPVPPDAVRLAFFLPKGAYATCLLREVMKAPARAY